MATYQCPKCESDNLSVQVSVSVKLAQFEDSQETSYEGGDHEWDDSSLMTCDSCHHCDAASSFEVSYDDEWSCEVLDFDILGELHGTLHGMLTNRAETGGWLEDTPMDALVAAGMRLSLAAQQYVIPMANAYESAVFTYDFLTGAHDDWQTSECLPAYFVRELTDEEWVELAESYRVRRGRIAGMVRDWAIRYMASLR